MEILGQRRPSVWLVGIQPWPPFFYLRESSPGFKGRGGVNSKAQVSMYIHVHMCMATVKYKHVLMRARVNIYVYVTDTRGQEAAS